MKHVFSFVYSFGLFGVFIFLFLRAIILYTPDFF